MVAIQKSEVVELSELNPGLIFLPQMSHGSHWSHIKWLPVSSWRYLFS